MCVHIFLPTGEYMCTHIPICTHILIYYARLHHRPLKFVSGHGVGEFVWWLHIFLTMMCTHISDYKRVFIISPSSSWMVIVLASSWDVLTYLWLWCVHIFPTVLCTHVFDYDVHVLLTITRVSIIRPSSSWIVSVLASMCDECVYFLIMACTQISEYSMYTCFWLCVHIFLSMCAHISEYDVYTYLRLWHASPSPALQVRGWSACRRVRVMCTYIFWLWYVPILFNYVYTYFWIWCVHLFPTMNMSPSPALQVREWSSCWRVCVMCTYISDDGMYTFFWV